ncbi:MAG: hypothetical protein F7B59_01795 [Desulfurococcales archaeon]|nr:hypothetical protein [Desulfurococcales archaeon]
MLKNKTSDPLFLVDKIFTDIESLEADLYTMFRSDENMKHQGIHLRIQEKIDDLYDELRELRRILFENKY